MGGHQLTPTVGQNRLQTSLANMSGSCPRHMEKPRQLHGLWEMGGSGVQHLGAGASPGGILIASHFRDLTQQLLKTHSWLVYERRLQCSRLLLQSSHELFLLDWTPSSHMRSTFLLREHYPSFNFVRSKQAALWQVTGELSISLNLQQPISSCSLIRFLYSSLHFLWGHS